MPFILWHKITTRNTTSIQSTDLIVISPLHVSSCVCIYFYTVSSLVYVCVSTPTIMIRSSSNIPRMPFSCNCNQRGFKCERLKTGWVQGKEKNRGKTLGDKIRNMYLLSALFPEVELLNPLNFLWKFIYFFFCLRRQLLVGSWVGACCKKHQARIRSLDLSALPPLLPGEKWGRDWINSWSNLYDETSINPYSVGYRELPGWWEHPHSRRRRMHPKSMGTEALLFGNLPHIFLWTASSSRPSVLLVINQ